MAVRMRLNGARTDGRGIGSLVCGTLLLALSFLWIFLVVDLVNKWIYQENYIEAELEVTKYHYQASDTTTVNSRGRRTKPSRHANQIEGIIHPGGQKVYTNDKVISVMIFDTEDSAVGYQPMRSEVEGKRYKVHYWPDHESSWYQPPTIFTGGLPETRHVLIHLGIFTGLLLAGIALVRRGRRIGKEPAPVYKGPGVWPAWTGGVTTLCVILWAFFSLLFNIVLPGRKLNKDGTQVLERTTKELIIGYGFTGLMLIVCLVVTGLVLYAVKRRLGKRVG